MGCGVLLAMGLAAAQEIIDAAPAEEAPVGAEAGDGMAGEPGPAVDAPTEDVPAAPLTVLDLETAQRRALADNPSLEAAEARVQQARERVRQARSRYFPRLDAGWNVGKTWLDGNTIDAARAGATFGPLSAFINQIPQLINQSFSPTNAQLVSLVGTTLLEIRQGRRAIVRDFESHRLSLDLSYALFDGFSRRFSNLAARANQMEFEAARREAQRLLLDAVAQAFFSVQLARENIAIAEADEGFNERQLRDSEARRRVGTGSLSDVLNFEVQIRAARSQRLNAERDYDVARIALAELMGVTEGALPDELLIAELHPEATEEMTQPETAPLIDYALEARPDLSQLRFAVDRTDATVGERRSVYYPQVNAFASQEALRDNNSRFERDDFAGTVGVSVNYNLFAGGANRARVAEAKAARREAELNLNSGEIAVAADVRQALVDLSLAQQELILQRATAEYVSRNRDLVEKEYDAGQASLTRLNEAQRDLVAAQGRLASARVNLRRSWHNLRTATAESLAMFYGAPPAAEEAPALPQPE